MGARNNLNEQRLGSVLAALKATGAQSVLDLGCGEGRLVRMLLNDRRFSRIVANWPDCSSVTRSDPVAFVAVIGRLPRAVGRDRTINR